jgi:hypothetical protein
MAGTKSKKPYQPDIRRDMEKELAAAAALKFQLGEIYGEGETDTILLKDMVEGETGLLETVDGILRQISADQSHIEGIKIHQRTVAERKSRLEKRVETMRSMLASALDILEERKFERPLGVITIKPTPPSLVITDEASIPAQFWKVSDPELVRKLLTDALKDHQQTLQGKLDEISAALDAGTIDADQAEEQRERIKAAFPSIPGAELDGGDVTVQIRFS